MQIAASLTFTTLLSLVPLIAIALSLLSAFPVFEDFSARFKAYLLANLVPDVAGKIITHHMRQFVESAARLTAVGIGFLAVTAMTMMLTIEHAFNTIWRIARPRPLFRRLIIYCAVLALAPLLVGASLSLTSWLVGLSMGYARHIPVFGVETLKVLPVLFTTLAFAILFRLLPNRHVPRVHALIGAIVAAVAFETMNRLFGYYISQFSTYKLVYGAFASLPVFLLWIYLSWIAILMGAVITASLPYWRAPVQQHSSPADQLVNALRLLQAMTNGLCPGRLYSLPQLSGLLRIGYDELERMLDKLAAGGMVREAKGGWSLARDLAHIRMSELFGLFVLDRAALSAGQEDDPARRWLADCAGRIESEAGLTLQELFARKPA